MRSIKLATIQHSAFRIKEFSSRHDSHANFAKSAMLIASLMQRSLAQ
jgi:hypothetical protein